MQGISQEDLKNQKYTSVQVLRGIAALMVVIFHLPAPLGMPQLNIPVLSSGVDLFFVISGFVMVVSTANRRHDVGAFAAQRFTRVVPFYWAMTLIMAAALLLFSGRAVSFEEILKSILFIPYLDESTGFVQPVLGVGWTLNLELLFYVLFATTLALGPRLQAAAIGMIFSVAVVARVTFSPAADTVLFFYTTPVLFEFLAGIAIGHLIGRIQRLPLAFGVSAFVIAVTSIFAMKFGFSLPRTIDQGIPAVCMVIGCLRLEACFRDRAPAIFTQLGDASYSLYLVHPIVLLAAAPLVATAGISPWLAGALIVAVCVVTSLATYRLIERPLLTLSRIRLRSPQVA